MCKHCEEYEGYNGYRKYVRYGGARIVFDPEDVGFLFSAPGTYTIPISHCPWCGRKLEAPEPESEFSAEDGITVQRFEGGL